MFIFLLFLRLINLLIFLRDLKRVKAKTKGVNVAHISKIAASVNKEHWFTHFLTSPHRAISHIKMPRFLTQSNFVSFIINNSLSFTFFLLWFHYSTKYQNSLPIDLYACWVYNSQPFLFSNKVKSFPRVSLNIINVDLLYEIVRFRPIAEYWGHGGQFFPSKQEDVLVIENATGEGLARMRTLF